jgi:hypothetical protein
MSNGLFAYGYLGHVVTYVDKHGPKDPGLGHVPKTIQHTIWILSELSSLYTMDEYNYGADRNGASMDMITSYL